MDERVTGPIHGYYIVSYACPMGELGELYLGMAKICSTPPRSYWSVDCRPELCTELSDGALLPSVEEALAHAEQLARDEIARLAKPRTA